MRSPADWIAALSNPSGSLGDRIVNAYGGEEVASRRLGLARRAIRRFEEAFPGRECFIVRVPGRINLLGMHVDHQGGRTNYLLIDREAFFVVSPREDGWVVLENVDLSRFPARRFRIEEELPPEGRGRWLDFIEEASLPPGDWANYVKAGVLKIQDLFADRRLCGFEAVVFGDVPIGSGMSSSSAIVVASALSALRANNLDVPLDELPEVCGEGEWLVGTRGGYGDHAAMLLSERDAVLHARFLPFGYERIPFPPDCKVLVVNTGIEARKTAGAKDVFNERVTTYRIAFHLLRKLFPEIRSKVEHLRDVNPENLGVEPADIYRMVKALPERMSREEAIEALRDDEEAMRDLRFYFPQHREPEGGYRVRGVLVFGIAEIERARIFAEHMRRGEVERAGELMFISHDGDRVTRWDREGRREPAEVRYTDDLLDRLIAESAPLHLQPGAYACSVERADLIVDLSKQVDGVYGARLTGAGLGGCVLVLSHKEAVQEAERRIAEGCRELGGFEPEMFVASSVSGAEVWD